MLKLCAQHSRKLFGKDCTANDRASGYFSPLKRNDKYGNVLFKMKMNTIGRGCVRVWDKNGLKREPPDNWQGLHLQAQVILKSIWIHGNRSFGGTFELTDAMIHAEAEAATCPFTMG